MELFKYEKPLSLMAQAKRFGILSIVLVITSLGLIFTKGFNMGIDFAGGTVIQVQYDQKAPIDEVREVLTAQEAYKGASVTYFGADEEIVIKTKTSSKSVGVDIGDQVRGLLKDTQGFKEVRRVDMVGAKVGSELREKGLMAMVLAIIGILIYVSFRFEWRFAVASVMALVHDVTIAMGMIVLFSVEVNLDILAA
jgi:preprotein translocase subunit SecF